MIWRSFDGIEIGALAQLETNQLHCLVTLIRQVPQRATAALGGRVGVTPGELTGYGAVVVKGYARGGLVGIFNRHTFFRGTGPTRPEQEFQMLQAARALGVNAPAPLAVALIGGTFYRGWLVMQAVPFAKTLVELAGFDEQAALEAVDTVVVQVKRLINGGLIHIDLHPGNILVSESASGSGLVSDRSRIVTLIDFDKAAQSDLGPQQLRDHYVLRWRRAVLKHNLPDFLNERFCFGLRSSD